MGEIQRNQPNAAGFISGDFEQFATEVLGMTVVEAREVQFRADLASAVRTIREQRKLTKAALGKLIGLSRTEVDRLEIAAPEIPLDLILKAYLTLGGQLRYEFDLPAVPPTAKKAAKSPAARKAVKA